jgi:hypothetical protein
MAVQVTHFELNKQREAEARAAAQARSAVHNREVGQADYEQLVNVQYDNTRESIDARDVDSALTQLSVQEQCAFVVPRTVWLAANFMNDHLWH